MQFHWDREGKRDQNSSCWLRVSQAWAGNQWGSFALPRIGQEVLVTFVDGDPDRPLVTGSVYNAATQPPYDLPANKTRTALKSQSTPGGDGFNELRIEDKKSGEQIFLHAEKDANLYVKNDWKQLVEHDSHLIVQKDAFDSVGQDVHLSVAAHRNIKVGKTLSEKIGADAQIKAGSHFLQQAGRELHMKGGQNLVLDAGMSITLKAGGGTIVLNPSGVSISGRKVRINSGGSGRSAKAASPVGPGGAGKVDPGKPGNPVTLGRSNAIHKVERIPFGTGAMAGPMKFTPTKPPAPAKYQAVLAQPYTQLKPLSPEQKTKVATAQANARDALVDDPENGYASALISAAPNTVHAHLEAMDAIENAHEQAMERYAGEGVMYEGDNWGLGQKTHEQKRAELTKQRNNALAAEAGNLETHVSGEMEHTTVIEDVLGVGALAGVAAKAGVKTAAKVLGENTKPGKVTAQVGDVVSDSMTALTTRDRVLANIAENKAARESSKFNAPKVGLPSREWPPFPGSINQVEADFTLLPGTLVDRFGPPRGAFLSPEGTPYSARALKPGTAREDYYVYEVLEPLTVKAGEIKPWFGEVGNGLQYRLDPIDGVRRSPQTLTSGDNPILKEVYRGKYWEYNK